jgi:hypothetical protein
MNRRERLLASLRGEPTDRTPVCFYEINGLDQDPEDPDPFNVFSHPTWKSTIDLARDHSDRIVLRDLPWRNETCEANEAPEIETWTDAAGSRFVRTTTHAPRRDLTSLTRQDPDVSTVWTLEHPLKNRADLEAWLQLPTPELSGEPDCDPILAAERSVGDTGIVAIDTGDPLCCTASLFEMGTFTVIASNEPTLFQRALERAAATLLPKVEAVARALPGRMWRIYGPEYATPPYLRPSLFHEYVTRYVTPMVQAIQRHGGFARIHCHGRIRDVLDEIAATGCVALDPIEPPPQGDVELAYVRERYGEQVTLFGNLEASDLEMLAPAEFEKKIRRALREGVGGRGFVLMPSACPCGRVLPDRARRNYEKMIEIRDREAT